MKPKGANQGQTQHLLELSTTGAETLSVQDVQGKVLSSNTINPGRVNLR